MIGMNSTNRNHRALAQPDRSRLRKMSMKTRIRTQIQITHRKIMKIVQRSQQRIGVGTRGERHGVSLAPMRSPTAAG